MKYKTDLIAHLEKLLIPKEEGHTLSRNNGQYKYVALELEKFEGQLNDAARLLNWKWNNKIKFVDVGCGIGTKVWIAKRHGFDVYGIEVYSPYAEVAMKMLELTNEQYAVYPRFPRIITADALTIDYSSYDVIYFYCPLADDAKQKQLEQQIFSTAKSGTYILANLGKGVFITGYNRKCETPGLKLIEDHGNYMLYQKE